MTTETEPTTAEAAKTLRGSSTQAVIAEAAKTPVIQAGQIHDRMLGAVIAGMLTYAATHVPGHGLELESTQAMTVGIAAGNLGTMIGAKIPEEYRSWLWAVGMFVGSIFGATFSLPS